MLFRTEFLRGLEAHALDGEVGQIVHVYFDDREWTVRYFIVNTGGWLARHQSLISPTAVVRLDWAEGVLALNLTREQVRSSPPAEASLPVSRQIELELHEHYGWKPYWGMSRAYYPLVAAVESQDLSRDRVRPTRPLLDQEFDHRLRSAHTVRGYHIAAQDSGRGHVDDFLINDDDWSIHYLVVATRNWLPGRRVVVPTEAVAGISAMEKRVWLEFGEDELLSRPELREAGPISPDEEATFRRPGSTERYLHVNDLPTREN